MSRPVIGVTVSRRTGWRVFPLIALNVWLGGGRAVRWQTRADIDLESVDGVVIGGGDDISPTLYGGELFLEARFDDERDAFEREVLQTAFKRGIPALGICRGSQMLNVVTGGTLHQDAFGEYGARFTYTVLPKRTVHITDDSRLACVVGHGPMRVNSLHRQSVNKLGRGLRIAAADEFGMVQAVERVSDPFAIGVQWHPEHLFYRPRHRALFKSLVAAARAYSAAHNQLASVDAELKKTAA
ncbi:gamma-glutamyl-gamma-aminobutyrate hydrolase family protein [Tropicimonas sp. S265A]|uniref:gamma-glutamyl-gamma-aminobutyrate hydrolase family protein n=1 Tax=Tropicimonas sp. S265A TaxID=3415134 RepID=UPI003C7C6DFA